MGPGQMRTNQQSLSTAVACKHPQEKRIRCPPFGIWDFEKKKAICSEHIGKCVSQFKYILGGGMMG